MATPMGFEPTISTVTGWHVNRYTTGPRAPERLSGHSQLYSPPLQAVNRRGATALALDIMGITSNN